MIFNDNIKFEKFTGMILDHNRLKGYGLISDNDNGGFETYRLDELREFCLSNPEFHIITETSDGDNSDDRCFTTDNCLRYVNRLMYYLGDGSKKDAFLEDYI